MREHAKWADNLDALKRAGDLQAALAVCRNNYPFPYAFSNAAVTIRKAIRKRRKAKVDYDDLLLELYQNAVCQDFFEHLKWTAITDNKLASRTAKEFTPRIACSYAQMGHKRLPALGKTDIKWLVERWGDVEGHCGAVDANRALWQEAVHRFAEMEKVDEKRFWRAHGFKPPADEECSRGKQARGHSRSGCLVVCLTSVLIAVLCRGCS